jgi:hypothetical protein
VARDGAEFGASGRGELRDLLQCNVERRRVFDDAGGLRCGSSALELAALVAGEDVGVIGEAAQKVRSIVASPPRAYGTISRLMFAGGIMFGLRLCGEGPELDGEPMTFPEMDLDQLRQSKLASPGFERVTDQLVGALSAEHLDAGPEHRQDQIPKDNMRVFALT